MSQSEQPSSGAPDLPREKLVLLLEDSDLQKALVTWKEAWAFAPAEIRSAEQLQSIEELPEEFAEAWAAIAGIRATTIDSAWPVLVTNGFIEIDGWTSATAVDFVQTIIILQMQKRR